MINEIFPDPEDFEFLVIPAPKRGDRAPDCKTDADRMANTLTVIFNEMAALGWVYMRTERLPNDQGASLSGTGDKEVTMLVFRRPLATPVDPAPAAAAQDGAEAAPEPAPEEVPTVVEATLAASRATPAVPSVAPEVQAEDDMLLLTDPLPA